MALEERKKGVCQTLKLRENVSTNLDMDVVSVEEWGGGDELLGTQEQGCV